MNLGIRCHVANADFFLTKCELTERIKKATSSGSPPTRATTDRVDTPIQLR